MNSKYHHTTKPSSTRPRNLLATFGASALLLAGAHSTLAQSGTWNNTAGGTWSTAGNWAGSIIANGAGNTAAFSTLDLTVQTTVTLDSARTLGTLIFGDSDTNSPAGWVLDNGGTAGNTLDVTNITVGAIFGENTVDALNDATISAVVTGGGFVKKGAGTLSLLAANTMGSLRLDEGLIGVGNATALGSGNKKVTYNGGGIRINTTGTIANTNEVLTTGHVYAPAVNYDAFNGAWTGAGTVYVHATSGRFTPGGGSATAMANFTGTIDLADSLGGLVRLNLGSGTTYDLGAVTLNLGTNQGRLAPRLTGGAQKTMRIGALLGGSNTQIHSSEQGTTDIIWEIGALNTSTVFDGRYTLYNGDAARKGGLKKVGTGKLTFTRSGHTYNGNTTISQGTLALSNTASIASSPLITVESGATFDVSGLATAWSPGAGQILGGSGVVTGAVAAAAGTLTAGSSIGTLTFASNVSFDGASTATNLFEIASTSSYDRLQVNGDLTFNVGSVVVIRVVPTGPFIPNGTYELIKWTGTLTGDESNLALEYPAQSGTLTLSTNLVSKAIVLTVSGVASAANLVWKGDGVANDWDLTTLNWLNGVTPSLFSNGDNATFNNTGSNNVPVNFAVSVNPASVTVNATKDYVFSSTASAGIIGSGGLLKTNTGVLTIANDNTYSGGTRIEGGVLRVGDGSNPNGSLGSGTVTNNAVLVYNRPDDHTNANLIVGSGTVVKSAANTLTIAGNNAYSGGTVVSNGTLSLSAYNTLGTGPVTLAGGNFHVLPVGGPGLGISNALVVAQSGTFQYSGHQSYGSVIFGPLTGTPGATLTVNSVNAAAINRLRLYGNFTNSVNLDLSVTKVQLAPYNAAGSQSYNGVISGPGQIIQRGNGGILLNNTNLFTGGAILSQGSFGLGADSVNDGGVMVSSPLGVGALLLGQETGLNGSGSLYASGGARTIENTVNYDNSTNNFTWVIAGANDLTLTGPITLHAQLDNTGGVNRPIQVDNTAETTFAGPVSDNALNCGLTKAGAGLLLLNGTNTYTGLTTVSNGALGGSGIIAGSVVVAAGGALAPGASIGTLTISGDLTFTGGGLAIEVNKSVAPSNDVAMVSGGITNAGTGGIVVTNYGPALVTGDKFFLFNKPVVNGGTLTVTGGGVNWTNKLALNGSIEVLGAAPTIPTTPTNITFSASGGNLTLTWPASHTGWSLQAQTNTRSVGLSTNWFTLPGYETTNTATLPTSSANPTVFYRLFYQAP